jgi:hypothetical protein
VGKGFEEFFGLQMLILEERGVDGEHCGDGELLKQIIPNCPHVGNILNADV